MAQRPRKPITLDGFPLGLDNRSPEHDLDPASLRVAENVDIYTSGTVTRRDGYARLTTSADTHSLWSHPALAYGLIVADGSLNRVDSDLTVTALATVNAFAPVSAAEHNGAAYWSNGRENGRVLASGALDWFWGVPLPGAPEPSVEAGAYDAGDYLVALTYLANNGEEGGSSPVAVITVAAGERVTLTSLPVPPTGIAMTRVYVSTADGEQLYHAQDVPAGITTVDIHADKIGQGKPLETLFLGPPPAGHIVRSYHARLFVAQGSLLWFTEALRPSLVNRTSGFFQFPARITLVEPADDGLYVCAGKVTYFLAGRDAADMQLRFAGPNGAIEGTGLRLPAERLPLQGLPSGPRTVWWSDDGVLTVGLAGGQLMRLTANRLAVPSYDAGSILYREKEGIAQLLTVLRDGGGTSALACSDSATAEVLTNGIS